MAKRKTRRPASTRPVKQSTLLGRVERVLKPKGRHLWRDYRYGPSHFMLVDKVRDRVIKYNVELTALARRLKVMRPDEVLEG